LSLADRVPRQQERNKKHVWISCAQFSTLQFGFTGRILFSSCGADPSRAKNGLSSHRARCPPRPPPKTKEQSAPPQRLLPLNAKPPHAAAGLRLCVMRAHLAFLAWRQAPGARSGASDGPVIAHRTDPRCRMPPRPRGWAHWALGAAGRSHSPTDIRHRQSVIDIVYSSCCSLCSCSCRALGRCWAAGRCHCH
jgi:hypothetical protein